MDEQTLGIGIIRVEKRLLLINFLFNFQVSAGMPFSIGNCKTFWSEQASAIASDLQSGAVKEYLKKRIISP